MNDITMIIIGGKMFAGKWAESENGKSLLVEAIEYVQMLNPQHGMVISGSILGDIAVPEDAIVITLSKDSPYYQQYFKTNANIHGVN